MTRDEAMNEVIKDALDGWIGISDIEEVTERIATVIQQAFAERDGEMRVALAPIMDWYQSDEHEPRKLADIAADAVADLQSDRADTLRYAAALRTIADAPAWGAPERFDVTPAEVRQLARQALAAKGDSRG